MDAFIRGGVRNPNLQPSVESFKLNDIKKDKVIPMSTIQIDHKGLTHEQVQSAIDNYIRDENVKQIMAQFRADQKETVAKARKERGKRTRIVNTMQKLGVPVNPIRTDYGDSKRMTKMDVATHVNNQFEGAQGCYKLSMNPKHEVEFHQYLDILRASLVFKVVQVQVGNYMGGSGNPIYSYFIRFMGDN